MKSIRKAMPPVRQHQRHPITTTAGSIAMTIEQIKQSELTIGEREVLERDRERYKKLGAGAHLDEWLEFYPGLDIRRRLAMRMAHTNQPQGKGYVMALNQLYEDDGFNVNDKTYMKALTDVLWLGDEPERMTVLREIREGMTPGQRSRLNSPIAARQRVKAIIEARKSGREEKVKDSPTALHKQRIVELERENATLRNKLARTGSLFDLNLDTPDKVADAIVANVTDYRVGALIKALTEQRKRKRQKPAG
jgi:hypothetical protein